ncbi:hypothetical protein RKD23_001050 [Streptomyces sp. SAI-170]
MDKVAGGLPQCPVVSALGLHVRTGRPLEGDGGLPQLRPGVRGRGFRERARTSPAEAM